MYDPSDMDFVGLTEQEDRIWCLRVAQDIADGNGDMVDSDDVWFLLGLVNDLALRTRKHDA